MAKLPTDASAAALSAALAAPPVEKDEFADAFAGFTVDPPVNPEPKPAATEAAQDGKETPAVAEGEETEIEGAPDPAEGDGGTQTPEQIAAEAKAAEDAAKAAKPQGENKTTDDALARLADILSQREAPKQPAQPQAQDKPAPLYTEAEVTQIQAFYKEWPEVAPAVEVLMRGAVTQATNAIFMEVARVIGPKLALLDQMADEMTFAQIKEALPDFNETLAEQVSAWVQTQPTYLRGAYTNVMQNGTKDEVTDLVQRYRQETGTAAPSGDRTTEGTLNPPPVKQAASLSPAAKKAAAALAPVNSKRTGSTQIEPQTFDEAFEVFSKAG